jgi:hypothetical protein
MSNIYSSTPEQSPQNSEIGRRRLVADARYGIQKGLLGLYPQMAADIARQRFINMQLVERSVAPPDAEPINPIATSLHSVPPTNEVIIPITAVQTIEEAATYQQLLDDLHNQIDEAYAA